MKSGVLYIVATPIGNLEDITLRALRVLREADLIAAEDTRHTQKLLNKYNIHATLTSYHDHNKEEKAPVLVAMMLEGKHVALVSDAGTPGISDPGYLLINLAVQEKIPVVPIPGAVAAIAALSISGLPTDRFLFEGFLPSRRAARGKRLAELHNEQRTLVLYEAPHRIVRTVDDLVIALGDRKAVVVRELTKVHEEIIRGTLSEIRDRLATGTTKGEFTIVVRGAEVHPGQAEVEPLEHLRNLILSQGLSKKDAIALAAKDLGLPKKEVYKESLKL